MGVRSRPRHSGQHFGAAAMLRQFPGSALLHVWVVNRRRAQEGRVFEASACGARKSRLAPPARARLRFCGPQNRLAAGPLTVARRGARAQRQGAQQVAALIARCRAVLRALARLCLPHDRCTPAPHTTTSAEIVDYFARWKRKKQPRVSSRRRNPILITRNYQ